MSFINIEDAELILGADFAPDSDKARLVLLSNTWMKNEVKVVPNPVDENLKLAACEIIKGILAKKIYAGQERQTTREMVDADGVKVDETYAESSREISEFEQIALALINAADVRNTGFTIPIYRG
ncbi:hypothetical protein EC844_12538 [Acinetobacter calcoaceticus]|uniref:Phage gp36-like protein n=1 Tax=Acinetobacter calcoaceticus TaxID=471 RepID=A0A4R1XJM8_ACICA|nr:hypothetical protein EC844_12538 [Acinetobacter calcoaceticus]